MLLERNGRSSSGRRTRHIDIRHYFVTDRVKRGDLRVERCPADDVTGDFFTKPLQGAKFRKFQQVVLNLPSETMSNNRSTAAQECVGKRSYADVVRDGIARAGKSDNPMTQSARPVEVPLTDPTRKSNKLPGNKLSTTSSLP